MFKIPTYDEIEKKESEIGATRTALKNELFLKRKQQSSSMSDETDSKTASGTTFSHKPSESESKQAKLDDRPKEAPKPNKPQVSQLQRSGEEDDDDDDDHLLHAFIQENKEILEKKPVETLKKDAADPKSNEDEVFKRPEVPRAPAVKNTFSNPPSTTTTNTTTSSSSFAGGSGPLVVNAKQRGNPILKHIRNVQWKFSDTLTPDYCMSRNSCAFYLSMKYHLLNPTYIHQRIKELGRAYDLRVLLAFVDVKEPRHCIKELEQISIMCNLTMILCWTNEEVGRYLETFKAYEFKSAEAIMEKSSATSSSSTALNQNAKDSNFISIYTDFLSQIKSINKTDASTLRHTFGSIKQISQASKDELNLCPGLGPLKVNRLYEIFRTPFVLKKK
jgi:DNA excision repair protein ERCC-1